MYKPLIEELESRQLLNNGSVSPPHLSMEPRLADMQPTQLVERAPMDDSGGHTVPVEIRRTPEADPSMYPVRTIGMPGFSEFTPREPGPSGMIGQRFPSTWPETLTIVVVPVSDPVHEVQGPLTGGVDKLADAEHTSIGSAGNELTALPLPDPSVPKPVPVVTVVVPIVETVGDSAYKVLGSELNSTADIREALPSLSVPHLVAQMVPPYISIAIRLAAADLTDGPDPARAPEIARTNLSASSLALEPADLSRAASRGAVEAASGTLALRLNAQPSNRLDAVVGKPGARVDTQGVLATRSSVLLARDGDGTYQVPEGATPASPNPSVSSAQPLLRSSLTDNEAMASMAPQPLRQVSDMLSTFPTLNVTALEQGMQHFLGQLQRAGEDLTGTGHGPGLGIWLAAGAAAALACEVGRRQLRRANHGQALDVYWMGTSPSDHAFGD